MKVSECNCLRKAWMQYKCLRVHPIKARNCLPEEKLNISYRTYIKRKVSWIPCLDRLFAKTGPCANNLSQGFNFAKEIKMWIRSTRNISSSESWQNKCTQISIKNRLAMTPTHRGHLIIFEKDFENNKDEYFITEIVTLVRPSAYAATRKLI